MKEMGALFHKEWGGDLFKPLSHRVMLDVNGRTHQPSDTLFVLYTQSFNSSRSWLRKLIPWVGRGMGVNVIPV